MKTQKISKHVSDTNLVKYTLNGMRHNPHGPAVKSGGDLIYYLNNRGHNIVGPTLYKPSPKRSLFYINGKMI